MLNLIIGGLTPPSDLSSNNNISNEVIIPIVVGIILMVFVIIIIVYSIVASKKDNEELDEICEKLESPNNLSMPIEKETIIEKKELTNEDVENLKRYKVLFEEGIITEEEYDKVKNQTLDIVVREKISMKCPNCGSENCQIINEVTTSGKDYDVSNGCCGYICLGPIGLLCGACGKGKETVNTNYWVCNNCGNKWRA